MTLRQLVVHQAAQRLSGILGVLMSSMFVSFWAVQDHKQRVGRHLVT